MRAFGLLASVLLLPATAAHADHAGIGRDATPAEVKAWDIDVRPDFLGLPPGSGSVADGEELWIAKCASCHGDFGDANHVFAPLVGNTTAEDIKTGRVASLARGGSVRTTMSKVSTVSTLWDFIHRAMPWNDPKSLSPDQVYAVVAYMLNLAEVVPADFVLSDKNIAEAQARMPNRNGMTREHGLWNIDGKPDTHNEACMKNCATEVMISSQLPDFARNQHGNLADQNRGYGPVRGQVTDPDAAKAQKTAVKTAPGLALVQTKGCTGCHGLDNKVLGPSFAEVAARYGKRKDASAYLADKIAQGGAGVWGSTPMPPQSQLTPEEMRQIADWLAAGAEH